MRILLFIGCVFVGQVVQAQQVHLKTGNFSVKHSDLEIGSGHKLKVERVYNSTTKYTGIFGAGWSYDYTKFLSVNPDGSIVTKECECEGKTNNVFSPASFDETAKSAAIEKIAAVVQGRQAMNPEELFRYKQRLLNNRGFFMDEWRRLIDLKLLEEYRVEEGTRLVSRTFGFELITKTKDGYEFNKGELRRYYNDEGRLVREQNNTGFMQLSYNEHGQLTEVSDNLKNQLRFFYNAGGLVKRVIASGMMPDTIDFVYRGNLLVGSAGGKETYEYQYNADGLLEKVVAGDNITRVAYESEGEKRAMMMVKSESDSVVYAYKKEVLDESELKVEGVSQSYRSSYYDEEEGRSRKLGDTKTSIFYITTLSEGFQYNYRTLNTSKGITEDAYNNEEGYPDKIIKGTDTTVFVYNRFGEVTLKENSRKREEVTYDPSCAKLMEYRKYDKENDVQFWTKFAYNANCDLVSAENSADLKIRLEYDADRKISAFYDDTNNKVLKFKYNQYGKPVSIIIPGEGSLNVTYASNGEIEKVDSDGGHKMALQVTQQFQNLLSVVKVDSFKPCKCTL